MEASTVAVVVVVVGVVADVVTAVDALTDLHKLLLVMLRCSWNKKCAQEFPLYS